MATDLVLGYSAFDLGLFSDKDPRLKLIKKAIRKDLWYNRVMLLYQ